MAERGGRMANGFRMGRGIARRGARRDISGQVYFNLINIFNIVFGKTWRILKKKNSREMFSYHVFLSGLEGVGHFFACVVFFYDC